MGYFDYNAAKAGIPANAPKQQRDNGRSEYAANRSLQPVRK